MAFIRRALSRATDPSIVSLVVMFVGLVVVFGFGVAAIVVGAVGFIASEVAG